MLKIKDKIICNQKDQKVFLRGIALGGWLMMEGYMMGGENVAETKFKDDLRQKVGKKLYEEFVWEFRKRFVTKKDVQTIKKLGFNCVRIPFNHILIEAAPFKIDQQGMKLLADMVQAFCDQKIYVILDMHAVPGSQNQDWHSDSSGQALFYEKKEFRQRYYYLWDELSKRFKAFEYVAGYDVMNEPVTTKLDVLTEVYQHVIKVIRKNADNHIIFLEGNNWAQEIEFLKDLISENIAYSVHFYEPYQYVFNQYPNLTYPGKVNGKYWDKRAIEKFLARYSDLNVPVYVGEFGVASRCPHCFEELRWVKDVLTSFKKFGFHYTYWTYKSVAGMCFPDGLFQSFPQHPGMENVAKQLLNDKKEYFRSLETSGFRLNKKLMRILSEI